MKELYIFCEGQTEQGFCSRVLQPYFFPNHDGLIHTIRIAHSRRKQHRTNESLKRSRHTNSIKPLSDPMWRNTLGCKS